MKHVILFLLLLLLSLSASGQRLGTWYDCSHTDDYEELPSNWYTSYNGATIVEAEWYKNAKAICAQRGHEWFIKEQSNGPVQGGPYTQDDSTQSVLHEVLNRDYVGRECARCRTTRTVIKWKVRCKVVWRKA